MLKVGIVGGRGLSTVAGFKNRPELCEVTAICDLDDEVLDRAVERYNIPHRYRIYEDMLESDIDAVVIATPMQCHVPMAIQALESGRHVLSEVTRQLKPRKRHICLPKITATSPRIQL